MREDSKSFNEGGQDRSVDTRKDWKIGHRSHNEGGQEERKDESI